MGIKIVSSPDDDDEFKASTPYAGSSGWSGSDTSKARADKQDADGTTRGAQLRVIRYLADAGVVGATWKEIDVALSIHHHGKTTGALSVLHKDERIARLSAKRNNCKIYVLPEYVNGRETERQGR